MIFAVLALTATVSAFPAAGGPAPNILLIVADDLGVDMINAYAVGTDMPPTPNLDALAQSGMLFRNVWSSPVCSPTRAGLQTGRYTFRNGIGDIEWQDPLPLPLEEITIPEMLDAGTNSGYAHALFGKWHLGQRESVGGLLAPNMAGYQHFSGAMENFVPPDTFYSFQKVVNGAAAVQNKYSTTDYVDSALSWVSTAAEPWFVCLNFNSPHSPFHEPPAELHTQDLSGAGDPNSDSRPYYKAMVEAVDTEIGRLLTELGDTLDETMVIFIGDNGTPGVVTELPFDPDRAKGTLYQAGINVPMIVSGPMVVNPGQSNALISTTDLFATIAEFANADLERALPEDHVLDSVSFAPYLSAPSLPSIRQSVFSERYYPTGVDHALEIPITTTAPCFCQKDIGYGGPGNAVLSLCGDVFSEKNPAFYLLANAPPDQLVLMYWSPRFEPTPMHGGTITPMPAAFTTLHETDVNGFAEIPNLSKGLTVYAQCAISDPTQPEGFAISNTVKSIYPMNVKALRNDRYKLISRFDGRGPDEFYDLLGDPNENSDLLALGSLTFEEEVVYREMKREMNELLYGTNARTRTPPPPEPNFRPLIEEPCPPGR